MDDLQLRFLARRGEQAAALGWTARHVGGTLSVLLFAGFMLFPCTVLFDGQIQGPVVAVTTFVFSGFRKRVAIASTSNPSNWGASTVLCPSADVRDGSTTPSSALLSLQCGFAQTIASVL